MVDKAEPQRWLTLDAARGAAALAVVLFHLHNFGPDPVAAGYRGVDFFFVLSGFVIADAYTGKLSAGMSLRTFASIRWLRLYPLYLLGLILGLLQLLSQGGPAARDWLGIALSTASGLVMAPGRIAGLRYLYPLDNPAWSLFYELLANAAFALALPWTTPRRLLLVVCAFLIGVTAVVTLHGNLSVGPKWSPISVPGALVRVGFCFFAGVLVHRFRPRTILRSDLVSVSLAIAPALLCIPLAYTAGADLAVEVVAFPTLVWLGAAVQPRSGGLGLVAAEAGLLSYGVYALHFPILLAAQVALNGRLPPASAMAITLLLVLIASALATHLYDLPTRRWFARRRLRRSAALSLQQSALRRAEAPSSPL